MVLPLRLVGFSGYRCYRSFGESVLGGCSAFDYGISEYHEDCENWQAERIFGDSSSRSGSWLDD
jgi:hypothetical protein